jgi:serine/threonine-protein kinase
MSAPNNPSNAESVGKLQRAEACTTADIGPHLVADASGPRAVSDPERSESSALLAPGSIVADKYLIEGILGEGGLGVVVAATHLHLDQRVAIKYLRGKAPRDRTVTDRFLREARLAAQIKSEHVVRVFDVATLADGTPYMVMEHLEGSDLRTRLADGGALPFSTAIDYVLQACEALAEAHVQGIVHRDLKPDNLFLAHHKGGKEVVKILDFGISKLSEKYTSSSRVNLVTQAGDRLGTPLYMSPEQLEGDPHLDARADLWAMGVVLYELCTGAIPFTGDSLPALCTSVLTKSPIPPTTLLPDLPPELDLIIARCLAKARADRYQNVAELAAELGPFASVAGQARVRHTIQTIVDAGDSVRAPRWERAEGAVVRVPSDAPASSFDARESLSVPSSRPKPWVVALALLSLAGMSLLGGHLVRSWTGSVHPSNVRLAPPATTLPSVPAATTAVAAAAPSPPPTGTTAENVPSAEPEKVAPAPVRALPAASSAAHPLGPAPQRATGPSASSKPRPPASSDTTGVLDPFE